MTIGYSPSTVGTAPTFSSTSPIAYVPQSDARFPLLGKSGCLGVEVCEWGPVAELLIVSEALRIAFL
jgi:hypothetical protein